MSSSSTGTTVVKKFCDLTGATPTKEAPGDACLDGFDIEVKTAKPKATDVRPFRYVVLVLWNPDRGKWHVYSPDAVLHYAAQTVQVKHQALDPLASTPALWDVSISFPATSDLAFIEEADGTALLQAVREAHDLGQDMLPRLRPVLDKAKYDFGLWLTHLCADITYELRERSTPLW